MSKLVIDRKEQKYFITDYQYKELIDRLGDRIVKDKYFMETIYNVYFDNDNYDLINRSIEKPLYKEKVRVRSYDIPIDDTIIFLEIKKKYKDLSNKRRIKISYKDFLNYINNNILPYDNQIMKEIDYCFKKYNLIPKINLTYDRLAYYFKENSDYRLTFDNNIRFGLGDKLDSLNDCDKLFDNGYIMEVKTLMGLPIWFSKLLDELNIYPKSFSKVGRAYELLKEGDVLNV